MRYLKSTVILSIITAMLFGLCGCSKNEIKETGEKIETKINEEVFKALSSVEEAYLKITNNEDKEVIKESLQEEEVPSVLNEEIINNIKNVFKNIMNYIKGIYEKYSPIVIQGFSKTVSAIINFFKYIHSSINLV